MGYSILKEVDRKTQSRLVDSLRDMLDECNCQSLEIWFENILVSAQFQSISDEESSLYCIDDERDLVSMRFPAMLDLEGENSRVCPYFSLEGHDNGKVSIIILIIMYENLFDDIKDSQSICFGSNNGQFSITSFIKFICV